MLLSIAPTARTPGDKRSSASMKDYVKKLTRALEDWTPWRNKVARRRESLHGKVKPGEVKIILDPGESSNHPLYKDAKVERS